MISLQRRIVGTLLITAGLTILVFGFLVYAALNHTMNDVIHQKLTALAEWIAPSIVYRERTVQLPDSALFSYPDFPPRPFPQHLYAQIWDSQGKTLYRTNSLEEEGIPYLPHKKKPIHFRRIKGAPTQPNFAVWVTFLPQLAESNENSPETLELVEPGTINSLTLAIGIHDPEMDKALDNLQGWMMAVGALTLLLIAGLGSLFVKWSLLPLREVETQIENITEENLSYRFNSMKLPREMDSVFGCLNNLLQRLEKAFEREKCFTADAAHELRTPLSAIHCSAEVGLMVDCGELSHHSTLQNILNAGKDMQETVEDLLLLARTDRQDKGIIREVVSFGEIAAEAVDSLRLFAQSQTVDVLWNPPEEKIFVNGDAFWLGRLCRNLIANAVQYNRPEGCVTVSLHKDATIAVLRVIDTGVGIPEEQYEKIYERFYRIDPSRSRTGGGAGLGLSIVKRVVDLHDGQIQIKSRVGEGSEFVVSLPFMDS